MTPQHQTIALGFGGRHHILQHLAETGWVAGIELLSILLYGIDLTTMHLDDERRTLIGTTIQAVDKNQQALLVRKLARTLYQFLIIVKQETVATADRQIVFACHIYKHCALGLSLCPRVRIIGIITTRCQYKCQQGQQPDCGL